MLIQLCYFTQFAAYAHVRIQYNSLENAKFYKFFEIAKKMVEFYIRKC